MPTLNDWVVELQFDGKKLDKGIDKSIARMEGKLSEVSKSFDMGSGRSRQQSQQISKTTQLALERMLAAEGIELRGYTTSDRKSSGLGVATRQAKEA